MANYLALNNVGNVTGGHLNRLQDDIGSKGHPIERIFAMTTEAVDKFPYNETPTPDSAPADKREFNIHRGLRIRFRPDAINWEGKVESGPFRLDFQGFTSDQRFANWQVQTGVGQGGTVAAILMELDPTFSRKQFAVALLMSAELAKTIRLTMTGD